MNILIIEDEKWFFERLKYLVEKRLLDEGIELNSIKIANTRDSAEMHLSRQSFDLVFFDLTLNEELVGLEIMEKYLAKVAFPVVVSSHYDDQEIVDKAYSIGAQDFLKKPFNKNSIKRIIDKFCYHANGGDFRAEVQSKFITTDEEILDELAKIRFLSIGGEPLLIHGETGSGKNHLVEEVIYKLHFKKKVPFVSIDCFSLREDSADLNLQRKIDEASGGILYLRNFDQLKYELQDNLSNLIEINSLKYKGRDNTPLFPLILATTKTKLEQLVSEGKLKQGLKNKFSSTIISVPPLRTRPHDIELLIDHFLKTNEYGRVISISQSALKILKEYSWPGNVKELKSTLDRFLLHDFRRVTIKDVYELQQNIENESINENYKVLNQKLLKNINSFEDLISFIQRLEMEFIHYTSQELSKNKSWGSLGKTIKKAGIGERKVKKLLEMAKSEFDQGNLHVH